MKKYIYIAFAILFSSCNDFLDKNPSKNSQVVISTVDQLDALLGNFNDYLNENNLASVHSTDDTGLDSELYKNEYQIFSMATVFHCTWDVDGVSNDSFERNWLTEYRKIFNANLVLDYLDKVKGDKATKDRLRREAHFIRAVSFYQLINTYTMLDTPANQNEMGIVLKNTTSFEENIKRSTIQKSYQQIEEDLKIALEDNSPIILNGKFRPWRISGAGTKAFAARYYLQKANYDLALTYAENALKEYSALVDYNTEFRYDSKQLVVKVGAKTIMLDMPYTWKATSADVLNWKEFMYARTLINNSGWYIPSKELMDLYDKENDLRYRYHFVEDFSFYRNAKSSSYPGYVFFNLNNVPSGPTVAEMLLIKAECLIRKGQWIEGMKALEALRVKRIETKGYKQLVVNNASEALKVVLEERRREMPFSMRWFDARRLNQNSDQTDDVEFTKMFYHYSISAVDFIKPLKEYKLSKDSRRWANPISTTEINSSQWIIEQNRY